MAMAQGADGNAATITGPNGQQQPAYYVQQPVYLDQNGQPVYYRVGESLRVQLILCFFTFLLFFSLPVSSLFFFSSFLLIHLSHIPFKHFSMFPSPFIFFSLLSLRSFLSYSSQSEWSISAAGRANDLWCPHTTGSGQPFRGSSPSVISPV